MGNIKWSENENKVLYDYYNTIDNNAIKAMLPNRSMKAIWDHVRLLGLSNKYILRNYNETSFDTWTERSAYWLGFLYADGCMHLHENSISLEISRKDLYHIEKLRDWVAPNAIIYERTRNDLDFVNFRINNKHIYNRLKAIGMFPNKSNKIGFPESLPSKLYSHFIRGLIDGDGCIYTYTDTNGSNLRIRVHLMASDIMLNTIGSIIKDNTGIETHRYISNSINEQLHNLHVNGKNAILLLDWIYKDSTLFLGRKRNVYIDYLENTKEREILKTLPKVHKKIPYNSEKWKAYYYANRETILNNRKERYMKNKISTEGEN